MQVNNKYVIEWVNEVAELTKPDSVVWIDGSEEQAQKLREEAMSTGELIELNEAFASQALYCIRTLGLPEEKVNPWGGAMALGHPQGATGIFLTIKALDFLQQNGGKYALITMCVGGGQGAAGVVQLLLELLVRGQGVGTRHGAFPPVQLVYA